jgi:hypothetical protein
VRSRGATHLLGAAMLVIALAGAERAGASPASSAPEPENLTAKLAISTNRISTHLGEAVGFTTTITNTGPTTLSGLVTHLNIASYDPGVYVDPEDWSGQRTKYLGPLDPGQSVDLDWKLDPVNGGDFAIYVVAVAPKDPGSTTHGLAVSPEVQAHVIEQRTLNPGGVVPLAVAIPGLIGLLALVPRLRRARRS